MSGDRTFGAIRRRPGEALEGTGGLRRAREAPPSYSRVPGPSSLSPGLPMDLRAFGTGGGRKERNEKLKDEDHLC